MKAIIKEPRKRPEAIEIENELASLQQAVGGHIEAVTLGNDWCVLCDEEGRIKGKAGNCSVDGVDFCGTILFVGVSGEDFADVPQRVAERLGVSLC